MADYILSPLAKEDIVSIWNYTLEHWGEAQADRYIDRLDKRFAWLAKNPQLGRPRDEIKKGYYSFPQDKHIVFYRITGTNIEILGVPHQCEDPEHHLTAC